MDFGSGPRVFRAWVPEGKWYTIYRTLDPQILLGSHETAALRPGGLRANFVTFHPCNYNKQWKVDYDYVKKGTLKRVLSKFFHLLSRDSVLWTLKTFVILIKLIVYIPTRNYFDHEYSTTKQSVSWRIVLKCIITCGWMLY